MCAVYSILNNFLLCSNSSASSLVEENYLGNQNTVYYNPIDGTELGADEKTFFADNFEEEYNAIEYKICKFKKTLLLTLVFRILEMKRHYLILMNCVILSQKWMKKFKKHLKSS